MSLAQESSAFFDELTKIIDQQQAEREDEMDKRDASPYSSQLTQDEEPSEEYNPHQVEEPEPEVVTRAQA
jgi:hypothetical protein